MIKKIKNLNINYEEINSEGKNTIVLLHGWGQNIQMMMPIANKIKKENRLIIVDLPGHGFSEEPSFAYTVEDYMETIKELLDVLKIKNPTFIGHSFGGKISLLYASRYKTNKLILFGSPFKKEVEKVSFKLKVLKTLKKVPVVNKLEGFAKKHIGSSDYKNASDMMRQILVNTVNLDIREDVKKITCPSLLIWGTMDEAVSLESAYELESLLKDAAVIEFEGCTHYAYLERLEQSINIIKNFIN